MEPIDPREQRYRAELPPVEDDHRPVGYRPGLQLGERLQGLGVVALGVFGLLVAYLMFTGVLPLGLPPPAPPPGVLVQVPTFNPAGCVLPLLGLGSVGCIFVGFKRALDP